MRILHVIQEMAPGGAERVVVSLAGGASADGNDVAVAAARGSLDAELACERFDIPIVRRRPGRLPMLAMHLRSVVRAWRPDVVHCHNPTMAAGAALATRRGRRPPALVSVHGVPDRDYAATAAMLRVAGMPVIACGPGVEIGLRDHGLRTHRTIPNGVSPAPPALDRGRVLELFRGAHPARVAASVGRLAPQKNHALAIEAVARLAGVGLVIVGDGPLRADLAGLAKTLGVADRVALTGARADARAVMGAADVVVLPSNWEGMPLVALEALGAGVPLVATAVRGIVELMTDEVDCLLTPPRDPAALAAAIDRVTSDPLVRERLVEEGLRRADDFGEHRMVRRYAELYRELVERRPPSRLTRER
jgi:glycosyltransferase involved in cell wall biosynthesis